MKKTQIRVVIEGMPQDDGLLRADAFINELNAITKNISAVDKLISGKGTPSFYLRIVELSYGSPATVVMEAIPDNPNIDLRDKTINKLYSAYQNIEAGTLGKREIEYSVIAGLIETTSIIGRSINSTRIISEGYDLNLTKEFKAKLDMILAPEEKTKGFLRGMLEYINIHQGKNIFRIYPDVGPIKVTCHFPAELMSAAISAVGKYIEAKGELRYKAVSRYAHEIIVEEIEVFPPNEEIPSLYDLRGIAPDMTGSLSSEEFVRKIRDASIS